MDLDGNRGSRNKGTGWKTLLEVEMLDDVSCGINEWKRIRG